MSREVHDFLLNSKPTRRNRTATANDLTHAALNLGGSIVFRVRCGGVPSAQDERKEDRKADRTSRDWFGDFERFGQLASKLFCIPRGRRPTESLETPATHAM